MVVCSKRNAAYINIINVSFSYGHKAGGATSLHLPQRQRARLLEETMNQILNNGNDDDDDGGAGVDGNTADIERVPTPTTTVRREAQALNSQMTGAGKSGAATPSLQEAMQADLDATSKEEPDHEEIVIAHHRLDKELQPVPDFNMQTFGHTGALTKHEVHQMVSAGQYDS